MYGKSIPVPRDESLFGDLRYEYRGTKIEADPWPDFLLEARDSFPAERYANGKLLYETLRER
ncbi:hypothetical protein [Nostoc sp.]|uniref:hypothetical protein n=1 Tax=Nostoc sp. TaxID=1180 RepID=UPI002FF88E5A